MIVFIINIAVWSKAETVKVKVIDGRDQTTELGVTAFKFTSSDEQPSSQTRCPASGSGSLQDMLAIFKDCTKRFETGISSLCHSCKASFGKQSSASHSSKKMAESITPCTQCSSVFSDSRIFLQQLIVSKADQTLEFNKYFIMLLYSAN